ncbi:V-type ATP synthase subunit I [candidate division KSB3 bacterium]|uniref:V-type ATP synthase subunit I n=1 Tax=candidate division KSB3 bacterium TaxID=2044937 RepID=A0A2G6KGY9_9BACT|nr:MAG: V-type ATP synthase subunit I [candidate division KSB3 bacterium]
MSIVALVKVTAYGHIDDKAQVLEDLQELGCLHLVSLSEERDISRGSGGPTSEAREALHFLQSCPRRRKQVLNRANFDPAVIEQETLILMRQIKTLEDRRDFLLERIANLRPWGDFQLPPHEDLAEHRLWFYLVPHYQMKEVEATGLIWEVVKQDNRFCYVVVVSQDEPEEMPVPRVRTGSVSLSELERELEDIETDLEDFQAERESLTKWYTLYARSLNRLEDIAAREAAAQQTFDDEMLFALQAWAPVHKRAHLLSYAEQKGLALDIEEPAPDDEPPTLLENESLTATSGQDLVSFYMTPGYRLWDPSTVIFFSFVVFFAMILSDAGYGLLLGGVLWMNWKRMGISDGGRRFRILMSWLVGASVLWGVLLGSYFGISLTKPSALASALASFQILDINNYSVMMLISILLGVGHLIIANAADAWCKRNSDERFASFGWIAVLAGGFFAWLGSSGAGWLSGLMTYLGGLAMLAGAGGILWFTKPDQKWWKRLIGGLQGFTKLSAAFGDTLSYLRLFALGLAGASLSATFNDLGAKIDQAVPGIGILFAILVILFGHSLNLVLSIASAVIHGLRLNFIEFFNWSVPEEGYLFKAFARKETHKNN